MRNLFLGVVLQVVAELGVQYLEAFQVIEIHDAHAFPQRVDDHQEVVALPHDLLHREVQTAIQANSVAFPHLMEGDFDPRHTEQPTSSLTGSLVKEARDWLVKAIAVAVPGTGSGRREWRALPFPAARLARGLA